MVTRTDAYPDIAIPPGEYLAEEIAAREGVMCEICVPGYLIAVS